MIQQPVVRNTIRKTKYHMLVQEEERVWNCWKVSKECVQMEGQILNCWKIRKEFRYRRKGESGTVGRNVRGLCTGGGASLELLEGT